jgi:uncharacterized protein
MTVENGPSQSKPSPAEAAVRESSMEDILASIRRIIADDDALPLSRPRAAAPELAHAAPVRPVAAAEPAVAAAPAFRPPAPRVAAAPDKAPSLSLRDFAPSAALAPRPPIGEAAAVSEPAPAAKAEPAAKTEPSARAAPTVSSAPAVTAAPVASRTREMAHAVAEAPRLPPAAPVAQLAEARLKAASASSRPIAAAREPAPPPPEPVAEKAPEPPRPVERRIPAPLPAQKAEAGEPALLSSASGARVGASFEALAESLLLRDPEMIERMAREMLRPMLKDWLDDNLPVVVERLVRAEIERIARGRG